ncbi:Pre-mRNA-splicing factor CWC24 [Pseudozyma hubeiensis]|nr:Pre-mRNA-splicing factor CWC24 [Pseudozyma hubeiensis]
MDAATEASASAPSTSAAAPAVVFKRKRGPASRATSSSTADDVGASSSTSSNQPGPSRVSRDRSDSDTSGSDNERSAVVVKKKRSNRNPLVQSTGSVYRKSKLDSSHDSDDEYPLESNQASRDVIPTTTGSSTASSLAKIREDATKHSDWDLDNPPTTSSLKAPLTNSDGLYRGAKSYTSFTPTRDDGTSSKIRARGPIRSTTTVRTTSLMDYQPDVCKDYKETGYCGFGDTCKFLHDRSDYLAGWQLDVLPNSTSRGRENILSDPEDESEEQIPFACLICRQPFTDPVVTRCGHYFCSACAIKRFSRNTKCFACGKQTGGLFNSAKKVLDRMQAANRVKEDARREKHAWLDDEPSIRDSGADQDSDDD